MDLQEDQPISSWSVDKVIQETCYRSAQFHVKPLLDLAVLERALRTNDVDGESLLELKDQNIKEDLGILSFGQRREVLKVIHQLQERATRPSPAASKRTLESDVEITTGGQKQKKRRVEPHNVYSGPSKTIQAVTEARTDEPHVSTEELEDHWKDLLRRFPCEKDEEALSSTPDSENGLQINTSHHRSLSSEFKAPDNNEQANALPKQEVNSIINGIISDMERNWIAQKQHHKYKKALQYWESSIRAGTRRPAQNFIMRQLESFRERLNRMTKYILDQKLSRLEEVRQACLNMEATVEDCAEWNYYLQVLDQQHPPVPPTQVKNSTLATAIKTTATDIVLETDEEIIDSAEERSVDREDVDSTDNFSSLPTDGEESIPVDLLDDEWFTVAALQSHQDQRDATVTAEDFSFVGKETALIESPTPGATPDAQMHTTEDSNGPVIMPEDEADDEMENFHPTFADGFVDSHVQKPSFPAPNWSYDNKSTYEGQRASFEHQSLPGSRYCAQGQTRESAIDLSSSTVRSSANESGGEDLVRTPPLNPEFELGAKHSMPPSTDQRATPRLRDIWSSKPISSSLTPKLAESPVTSQSISRATQYQSHLPEIPAIDAMRKARWSEVKTPELALCKVVYGMDRNDYVQPLLNFIAYLDRQQISLPSLITNGISAVSQQFEDIDGIPAKHGEAAKLYAFCFVCYTSCRGFGRDPDNVSDQNWDRAFEMAAPKAQSFHNYFRLLLNFYMKQKSQPNDHTPAKEQPRLANRDRSESVEFMTDLDRLGESESEADHTEAATSSPKRRKRPVKESREAKQMQRDDRRRVETQEERRVLLMTKFQAQAEPGEKIEIPVNTTDPTIFLDAHIANRVKAHQIRGIQFLWRELIDDPKQQGCLLAHTMGLGKTMQVISLLVTIAKCVADPSPQVRALIPDHLRTGKTLILCPATLVENWFDEILMWCPEPQLLGPIYKIGGDRKHKVQTVCDWSKDSGILLAGYETFRSLLDRNKASTNEDTARIEKALLQEPAIVIADEAHKLKNPKSSLAQTSRGFSTNSRIALTGSPLNNHLEEYHTMIDWIAPGYLGTIKEFRAKYIEIINRGLYSESTRYEKRKSLEKLYVLKRDLAPKINRADISAISAEMPHKVEFYLTIPLTQVQRDIYKLIIEHLQGEVSYLKRDGTKPGQTELWKWLSILSWLCNHPFALLSVLMQKETTDVETARAQYQAQLPAEDGMEEALAQDLNLQDSQLVGLVPHIVKILDQNGPNHADASLSVRADMTCHLIKKAAAQGEKTLLFSHSIPTLNYLQTVLQQKGFAFERIDGSVKVETRQQITKTFNDEYGECKVFLISTRAGGLGLNLQGANRVIIFDFGFNPSWEEQAIGRAYRLGQKKPVFVYRFKAGGTFEEALYNKNVFKTQLFSRVVDQKNVIRHASRNVEDYLFLPREVEQKDFSDCVGKDPVLDRILQARSEFVRNVILTETFHKEDEEDELTKEEQELADREVELARLARTDPAEYHRRRDAEMRQIEMARRWRDNRAPGFEENFGDKLGEGVGKDLPDRSKLTSQQVAESMPNSLARNPEAFDDSVVYHVSRADQAAIDNEAAKRASADEDDQCRAQ